MSEDKTAGRDAADQRRPEDEDALRRRDLRYGLEEALDGELPEDLVDRMARHAEDCGECAEEIDRLRALKQLVRRSCTDTAPSTLRERIAVQCRTLTVTRTEVDGDAVTVTRTSRRQWSARRGD